MKQRLFILLAFIAVTITSFAEVVNIDGINYDLNSATNEASVTYGGDYSAEIVIPEKVTYEEVEYVVTEIGEGAFQDCSELTSVTIPSSVTSVGAAAFLVSGITSINIPSSVNSIGEMAFAACSNLTSLVVDKDNENYCSVDNVLFNKDMTELLCCAGGKIGEYTMPNSVTSLGYYAFALCESLTSISLSDNITCIPFCAFAMCSNLQSMVIPNSVTSIQEGAFVECANLISLDIQNPEISIDDYVFDGCTSLPVVDNIRYAGAYLLEVVDKSCTSATIKEGTKVIGNYAFEDCSALTTIAIPNSVVSIGDNAFCGCTGLTSVTIGNSVTSIGISAFSGCSGLTSIAIPNSVTSIGTCAFIRCSGLTSIAIPNSVTSIGTSAFQDCYALVKAEFASIESLLNIDFKDNPLNYAHNLYIAGKEIKDIIIPNSVTRIGSRAFIGCTGLTSVTIPSSVTSIGDYAFSGCSGLTSVTIPNSVTSIEDYAFSSCSGLTSIMIPNSVTSIDKCVFSGCSSLTSLTIPNTVTSIGYEAFSNCSGLTSVTIPNSVTNIDARAFYSCNRLASVMIPNSVTSIGYEAFSSCSGLTSVTIPHMVDIGYNAFYHCSNFNSLTLSCQDESDFSNYLQRNDLDNLLYDFGQNTKRSISIGGQVQTDIIIPNSVEYISPCAFYNCFGLTSVTIPNSVTWIDHEAFYNCSGLTSVTIPNSVTGIGYEAFYNCPNLLTLIFEGKEAPGISSTAFSTETYKEVPYGCVGKYKSALGWSSVKNIYTLGDANLSSTEPDVLDFNEVVNYVLGSESSKFFFRGADYNKNGVVNVGDAVTIGRLVVNGTTESRAKRFAPSLAPKSGQAILNASDKTILAGTEFTLPVSIAPDTYSSMQMDVLIPEGFNVIDVVNGAGAEEHSLFYGTPEDGMLRIMLGSLENTKMGDAPIVNIKLIANEDLADGQYDFAISNILAVTPDLTAHSGKNTQATVNVGGSTAIRNNAMSGMKLSYTDGGICLTSDNTQNVTVRSLEGKIIINESLNAGETKTLSLPAGIYIINNNKVVIK